MSVDLVLKNTTEMFLITEMKTLGKIRIVPKYSENRNRIKFPLKSE